LNLVFGHAREFLDRPSQVQAGPESLERPTRMLPAKVPGALLIRRADFEHVGPFREDLEIGSAIEWYARARDAGLSELVLPDIVLQRRVHGANLSLTTATPSHYAQVIRAILQRRAGQAR
jgi:hypothetical protein